MERRLSKNILYLPVLLIAIAALLFSGLFWGQEGNAAAIAYSPNLHIYDDATGGDCTSIGTWDAGTRTCTLTTDLFFAGDGIEIAGAGITLNGNGHTLTGSTYGSGVYSWGFDNLTLKNLTIRKFDRKGISISYSSGTTVSNNDIIEDYFGILLYQSSGNSVTGNTLLATGNQGISLNTSSNNNTVSGNYIRQTASFGSAISIWDSTGNIVSNNDVSSRKMYGIGVVGTSNTIRDNITHDSGAGIGVGRFGQTTNGNTIVSNDITSNKNGIWFYEGNSNIVTGNNISASLLNGVRLTNSSGNSIYNNSFTANTNQVSVEAPSSGNIFSLSAPVGGNYWDNWATPDSDNDGFVDSPFVFSGGQDSLPHAAPDGWCKAPQLGLNRQSIYWASMGDYDAGILSVDFTVDSFFDIYNSMAQASVSSNAVMAITPLPMSLGESINAGAGGSLPMTIQYVIPPGVNNFNSVTYATAEDVCGNSYYYPGAPPGP